MELVSPFYPAKPFSDGIGNAPPPQHVAGRTRLGKDTLRVGKWLIGYDANGTPIFREFADGDLEALCLRHKELLEAGIPVKLCWNHPPDGKPFPDVHDCVADIAEVWTDNGSLFFSVYVPDATREKLQEQTWPNSVGIVHDFIDGTGRKWPGMSLMHVACVSQATVPAQQPFIQLAAQPPQRTRMDIEAVIAEIDRLLDHVKPGAALPTDGDNATTPENLAANLKFAVDLVLGGEESSDPAEEEAPVLNEPPAADPLMMSLKTMVESLTAKVDALAGAKVNDAKAAFEADVETLLKGGNIVAAHREKLLAMGLKCDWDRSFLDPYRGQKALNMGSQTRSAASPKAPQGNAPFSESEKAAARKLLRLPEKTAA